MKNFYTDVHDLNHLYFNETLKRYRNRIVNELKIFGKNKDFFVGKRVLDIGTGFQGIVALEMGAESIIHVDINQSQLDLMGFELKRLGMAEKFTQINLDLNNDSSYILENYDIGLIFGVINHIAYPEFTIIKLQSKLNVGGELLFRAYNGKSLTRNLIAKIRLISSNVDYKSIENAYYKKYGDYAITSFHLRDLLDDLYSPIVKNFVIPSKFLIKSSNSLTSKDENLRFVIKENINLNISVINKTFILENLFSKIKSDAKVTLIINLYEIIRKFKYIDTKLFTEKYLKTNYKKNDFFKYFYFNWYILNFLLRSACASKIRIS